MYNIIIWRRERDFLSDLADLGCLALRASDNPSNSTASQAVDSLIKLKLIRREWDLNPRDLLRGHRLATCCLRPLGHLSIIYTIFNWRRREDSASTLVGFNLLGLATISRFALGEHRSDVLILTRHKQLCRSPLNVIHYK